MIRKALLCTTAGVLAVALACSKSTTSPASPTAATQPDAGAAADGSTLKAATPSAVSPTGGTQVTDTLILTASKASGKYADVALSYQFQIRSGTTVVYDSGVTGGGGSGNNVTHTPTVQLDPETNFTWRVRAAYQGAVGSWSSDASFKSPVGAYIRNGELRDPLTIGRTVGTVDGSVTFSSEGATINDQTSNIHYVMDQTVTVGEYSLMAKNVKSSAPGGKSKMMAIQQGFEDPTTNPYRFTIEKRGSGYPEPGATTCRIITGNADRNSNSVNIFDCDRFTVNYDVNHWYLWSVRWGNGLLRMTVTDTDLGRVVYDNQQKIGSKPYNPSPMVVFVGAPIGRAGPDDASVPRITVKNVWLSVNPRPAFPTAASEK
jgi:hypothetical protein